VRVFISEAGTVTAAELVSPVHPAYDRLLMEAVKSWRYEPARRGTVAVRSEKLVDVQLRPQ
jgi:TonB family protein